MRLRRKPAHIWCCASHSSNHVLLWTRAPGHHCCVIHRSKWNLCQAYLDTVLPTTWLSCIESLLSRVARWYVCSRCRNVTYMCTVGVFAWHQILIPPPQALQLLPVCPAMRGRSSSAAQEPLLVATDYDWRPPLGCHSDTANLLPMHLNPSRETTYCYPPCLCPDDWSEDRSMTGCFPIARSETPDLYLSSPLDKTCNQGVSLLAPDLWYNPVTSGGGRAVPRTEPKQATKRLQAGLRPRKKRRPYLLAWAVAHRQRPYPSEEEKRMLAMQEQLTVAQLNDWFINHRARVIKPEKQQEGSVSPAASSA